MEKEKTIKEKIRYFLTRREDRPNIQLDITLGLVSSFFLTIVYFGVYFYYNNSDVLFLPIYLIASFVMSIQFVIFLWIFIRKETNISKLDYTLIKQHSFLIMGIGIAISAIHISYDRQIAAFVIAIIISAIVSSHRPITSIVLYGTSLLVYGFIMSILHFDIEILTKLIQNSFYFLIIALFYSFIAYRRITKETKHMKELVIEVDKNKALITNLKNVNDEILRRNEITKAMMFLMAEVLKYENIDDFFDLVLKKSIELIPSAQKGSVLLYQNGELEYRAAYGYSLENLKKVKLSFKETFQYKLKDLYAPSIIKDLVGFDTEHLHKDKLSEFHKVDALGAKAVLTCAFSLKNQYFGSINLDNLDNPDAFSEEDKLLIKHLATQIEIALVNKDLLDGIRYMSRHDSLTKIYSRKYFEELLEKQYEDAKTNHKTFSISIIDTNDLKKFNDHYGHSAGDEFLIHFSHLIKETLRSNGVFGRTGGDEFTVFFPNMTIEKAEQQMKLLKEQTLSRHFKLNDKMFLTGFSYGLAEYPIDATNLSALVKLADQRMYQNKIHEKSMIEKS